MKVLQINSVCGIGSTGRIATDIHTILEEQGHESWIAYGRGEAKDCDNAIKIGNDFDNYAHVAKTRLLDKHGFGSKKATEIFIEKVKKIKPDIIHLHNIHGYYINIEVLFNYLKKVKIKVVWTLHDCWSFTGHCVHFEYINCDKWKSQCFSCPQLREYPTSLTKDNSLENYVYKKELFTDNEFLTIVTPSEWLSNLVKKSYLKNSTVQVINNGINTSLFKPTKSEFRNRNNLQKKFIVLGVARWDKRKGLEYFIQLAEELSSDFQIVVVGITEKQKKEIPENILAVSQTTNIQELVDIYSAANVFVNATLEDNFPTTNLEAQACGIPVITFDTGGCIETVTKETGIVIEKGNFNQLLNAIKSVEKNNNFTSDSCVEWVEKNFSSENRYNDYINIYQKII